MVYFTKSPVDQSDGGQVHRFHCFSSTITVMIIIVYRLYTHSLCIHTQGHLYSKFLEEESLRQKVCKRVPIKY